MPQNFSAVYAVAFCAGVYLPARTAWWLPFAVLLGTDVVLNGYYGVSWLDWSMLGNYLGYAALIGIGRQLSARASFLALLAGGLLGAVLFYLVTNTIAWLHVPGSPVQYAKSLAGWLQALTTGLPGYPPTWEFFRHTLSSGGLFTGLFVAVMKWTAEPRTQAREDTEAVGDGEDESAAADAPSGDTPTEQPRPAG